jgi:hypothetical protein
MAKKKADLAISPLTDPCFPDEIQRDPRRQLAKISGKFL